MQSRFVDTSHLIAVFDPNDALHASAVQFLKDRNHLVTSGLVLTEFLNTFSNGFRRVAAAVEVAKWLAHPRILVIDLDRTLLEDAVAFYASRPDKAWSLTDCASFLIMQDLGIRQALTADHHFVQAGFEALLPVVK